MPLGYRKESVISDVTRTGDELPSIVAKLATVSSFWSPEKSQLYPLSKVLRLRVLQIVCGISVLIMGAVACIEDKGSLTSLGLGVPAGFMTVIAAGASIHTTRGFGGYRASTWSEGSPLRALGPTPQTAAPLALLWTTACTLHIALFLQSVFTIKADRWSHTRIVVAMIQLVLSTVSLGAVLVVLRVDCTHDPD